MKIYLDENQLDMNPSFGGFQLNPREVYKLTHYHLSNDKKLFHLARNSPKFNHKRINIHINKKFQRAYR